LNFRKLVIKYIRFSYQNLKGINHGKVAGGVISHSIPHFDIWGSTVNKAARIEQHSKDGHLMVNKLIYS
jgi:class 3 adenylate cyclase